MIITVKASQNGGFTGYVNIGDTVTSGEILGSICLFTSCTPLRAAIALSPWANPAESWPSPQPTTRADPD